MTLVQNMFQHTMLTCLHSDNIKRDLQPYLELPNNSNELLLEKLNISCAFESERQDKTPQRSAAIHLAQMGDNTVEKKEKNTVKLTGSEVQPDILSELKEMRSNMALLNDLKAEVSQIKEFIQKPQCSPPQYPNQVEGPQHNVAQQVTQVRRKSHHKHSGPCRVTASRTTTPSTATWLLPSPHFPHQPPGVGGDVSLVSKIIMRTVHIVTGVSNDHFLAGCRMRGARQFRGNSLNGQGLLQRDRE